MKRILLGAIVLTVAAVPAVVGLWGNASFSQAVPIRVPASGQVMTPSPSPSLQTPDDKGGDVPRDQRTEPGDDRDIQGESTTPSASPSIVDDHGGSESESGSSESSDSSGSSGSSGSDSSGSTGTDNHGGSDHSDSDHGDSGGHGSDD